MRIFVLATSLALGGCATVSGPDDALACPPTYEFGNSGCTELTGLVTDRAGQPLAAATVGAFAVADDRRVDLGASYVQTDPAGQYRLRVARLLGRPAAAGPDTLSVVVFAGLAPAPGAPSGTAGPSTRTTVVATFAPVGTRPTSVRVAPLAVPVP